MCRDKSGKKDGKMEHPSSLFAPHYFPELIPGIFGCHNSIFFRGMRENGCGSQSAVLKEKEKSILTAVGNLLESSSFFSNFVFPFLLSKGGERERERPQLGKSRVTKFT